MSDILSNIAMGFGIALTWQNIGLCLFGCVIGTAIGVLPGIGPLTTMAMILPVTFWLSPVGALIMLSGVFYGAQYGGSTTAILVKIPGETSSVITVLDGHAMAQRGRAGPADDERVHQAHERLTRLRDAQRQGHHEHDQGRGQIIQPMSLPFRPILRHRCPSRI